MSDLVKDIEKNVSSFGNSDGRPRIDIDETHLLALRDSGKSIREITQILKVSDSTIRRRLNDMFEK